MDQFVAVDVSSSLEHYGVKGQKWGIRRTPAQLGHQTSAKKTSKKSSLVSRIKRKKKAITTKEAAAKQAKQDAKRRNKILSSPSKLYKHRSEFSQQEIDAAIRKFQWERNLRDLSRSEMSVAKTYIDTAVDYAQSGIKAYNTFVQLNNRFNTSGKRLDYIEGPGGKKKKKGQDD